MSHLVIWTFAVICAFVTVFPRDTIAELQANGCDSGWTDYASSCYQVVAGDITADNARNQCENTYSYLSSVWSNGEKAFILSLWQFPFNVATDLWFGLVGSAAGNWVYHDQSESRIKKGDDFWSPLKDLSQVPKATPNTCASFQANGHVTFKNCSQTASAYVCKKALPRVFIVTNYTRSHENSQLGQVQLFERLLPPTLGALPEDGDKVESDFLTSDVACAFKCFNLTSCRSFQVSCQLRSNCSMFLCSLYSKIPG